MEYIYNPDAVRTRNTQPKKDNMLYILKIKTEDNKTENWYFKGPSKNTSGLTENSFGLAVEFSIASTQIKYKHFTAEEAIKTPKFFEEMQIRGFTYIERFYEYQKTINDI